MNAPLPKFKDHLSNFSIDGTITTNEYLISFSKTDHNIGEMIIILACGYFLILSPARLLLIYLNFIQKPLVPRMIFAIGSSLLMVHLNVWLICYAITIMFPSHKGITLWNLIFILPRFIIKSLRSSIPKTKMIWCIIIVYYPTLSSTTWGK